MALGIDRAILLETDGREFDPIATSNAIVEAIRAQEAANGPFDLVLFGNEAADTGDFQVGIRVAVALDRPVVTGIKALAVGDGRAAARREAAGGGWETYDVPLPAVLSVKEGLNLPRYPSVPGRLRAKRKEVERIEPAWSSNGTRKLGLRLPEEQGTPVEILGQRTGGCRDRRGPAAADRGPREMSGVLVFVEHAGGEPDRLSPRGAGVRRAACGTAGGDVEAVLLGPGAAGAARRSRPRGSDGARRRRRPPGGVRAGGLGGGARRADRRAVAGRRGRRRQRPRQRGPRARRRPGPARPMVANVVEVTVGDPWRLTRQRWAGSLLEDAELEATSTC